MNFVQQRLSSASSRLLLILGVAILPLLIFLLASALFQSAPSSGAAAALLKPATPTYASAEPSAQGKPVLLADVPRSASDNPLTLVVQEATAFASNTAPLLALAALGMVTAWLLGRSLLALPEPKVGSRPASAQAATAVSAGSAAMKPDFSAITVFHQLTDVMPQLVSILHADCVCIYVNQRWTDYTGAPRSEILQCRWNSFVHPDDLARVSGMWGDASSIGESVEFEYRLRRADGCFRWMLGRAVPLPPSGDSESTGTSAKNAEWLMTSTDIDDLKQASTLLEKAVALKRLVGRIARLGGWTIELPSRALSWSPENCLIHEVPIDYQPTLEEGIGYFLPEHRSLVAGYVEACIAHGTPYDFVLPKHTAKHRLIWVRSIGEARRNEAGQIVGLQGAFQDVTEQKCAELRTQALEAQLTVTMNGITDGFYLLDKEWTFTYLNASAERMFKRQMREVIGCSMWKVFPDAVGTTIETEFRLTATTQKTRNFEVFYAPLVTWFDVHLYPMGDGVAVYLQDVTQTRSDQAQLQLLQTAVARLNDTVVIAEISATPAVLLPVVFVNEAFERCTGYPQDALLGKDFAGWLRSRLSAAEWARVSQAIAQWQPVRTEMAMTSKGGAALWLEVDVAPIADTSGSFTHWVAVKRDVTERRQYQHQVMQLNDTLEARVKRRTAQLESANKELESFAYAVSHDLRSPLNTIAGFVPMLIRSESNQLSDKGRHYLNRITAGVIQMGHLISGLLTLAHLSREQPRLETLDLTFIAQNTAVLYSQRQPGRKATVMVAAGLVARGDPRLIEMVLEQLIDNAWKFSSARSAAQIDIGSQPGEGGNTVFFVRDNGVGFDMAFQHKLFGTFERLHRPGEFEGTGIGLATVKRVIENHNGRIWAESHVGGGATFYFTLANGQKLCADADEKSAK